jgi:hypothetical protein
MTTQKSGSGQVMHPESDKRLKENQNNSSSSSTKSENGSRDSSRDGKDKKTSGSTEPDRDEDGKFVKSSQSSGDQKDTKRSSGHTPGAVTDPEHDGRLKENRDKGVKKSDDR